MKSLSGISDSDQKVIDRATRALSAFRRMIPSLTGFAQALTGDDRVTVEVTSGGPITDGRTIYLPVPIGLGDDLRHERGWCDQRDKETGKQCCEACAVRESIIAGVCHEISHVAFGTFMESDSKSRKAIKEAFEDGLKILPEHLWDEAVRQFDFYKSSSPRPSFMVSGKAIHDFLPALMNGLEDARVDAAMFDARPGTYPMRRARISETFTNGIETSNGDREFWADRPLNSQILIAMYLKTVEIFDPEWFGSEIIEALEDEAIKNIVTEARKARDARHTFDLSVRALERLWEMGFCEPPPPPPPEIEDNPEEEPDEESGEDGEDGSDPEEADEDQDGDGGESSSDQKPDESDDGTPGDDSSTGDGDTEGDGGEESSEGKPGGDDSDGEGDSDSRGPGESGDGAEGSPSDGAGSPVDGDESKESSSGSGAGTDEAASGSDASDVGSGAGEDEEEGEEVGNGEESSGGRSDHEEAGAEGDASGGAGPGDSSGDLGGRQEGGSCEDESGSQGTEDDEGPEAPGPESGDAQVIHSGSAEDAKEDLELFTGHGESHSDNPPPSKDEERIISLVVEQSDHFDQVTMNMSGVREFTYRKDALRADGWKRHKELERILKEYANRQGFNVEHEVSESVLGPALLLMRRVFADNQRAAMQKNLHNGKVNGKVLGKRAWAGDTRLFQKKRLPGKKSYAVLIGVDISGSTFGESIVLAKRAALAQAELCYRLGIDFAVYCHTGDIEKNAYALHIYKIKEFGQPWDTTSKEALAKINSTSANLDGHTMEYYRKAIENHPATDKILMYYSDGAMPCENHDEELYILKREIRTCKNKGISLLGVGINSDDPIKYGLPTALVEEDSDIIKVVKHLESQLLARR